MDKDTQFPGELEDTIYSESPLKEDGELEDAKLEVQSNDLISLPGIKDKKRNISTCQRHDLSMKYATIGNNIQSKLKYELLPELEGVPNWRQQLCWKYPCDISGPGGFTYRTIYDAMRAEKMRFMVDQLEIHTFLDFICKNHAITHPRDVVTVSDENFLSQNNMTLNVAVWDIVRRKLLYGYIRQRLRRDATFSYILQVLNQRSITPILFYPHSTVDTYYYGKLNRAEVDTTYQKTTLRKRQRKDVDVEEVRKEVKSLETQRFIIGKNMYGTLLLQAIRDHQLHFIGQTLNLRARRKLNLDESRVRIPMYNYDCAPQLRPSPPIKETELDNLVDDLLDPLFESEWKQDKEMTTTNMKMSPSCLTSTTLTLRENSESIDSRPSSPQSSLSATTSSGSLIY